MAKITDTIKKWEAKVNALKAKKEERDKLAKLREEYQKLRADRKRGKK